MEGWVKDVESRQSSEPKGDQVFESDRNRPERFDSGDPDEGAQGNTDGDYERALKALQGLVRTEIVACVAGVDAPDHGLILGGYLRAGEEVAEHNRHFAGESICFVSKTATGG
jgi:hypothetical protein